MLGTPSYMPPEQAAGKLDLVGPASDQYSLGVMLYELLCGSTPFSGPPTMVISLVINQEPPSPRKENPATPKDLETICLKAMSKRREDRYASCQGMAEDLRRWLAGEPITARRVDLPSALRPLVPPQSSSGRAVRHGGSALAGRGNRFHDGLRQDFTGTGQRRPGAEGADAGASGVAPAGGDRPSAVSD